MKTYTINEIQVIKDKDIELPCRIRFVTPKNLEMTQWNQDDITVFSRDDIAIASIAFMAGKYYPIAQAAKVVK